MRDDELNFRDGASPKYVILLCADSLSARVPGFALNVVILAGGLGTRISEESHVRPKPMIEIGGKPILWRIMTPPCLKRSRNALPSVVMAK